VEDLTDREVIHGVVHGDREMFEIIVRRYNPQLYRVGMAYLRSHAQTEDAMQNAYLKAFLQLTRFEGASAFSTWLTRIMINECLMLTRGQKRFAPELPEGGRPAEAESGDLPALEVLNAKETKALLEQSIAALPRTHRAVYMLREIQQMTTAEAAACLGISEANVKVSLHRAREGLKAQLLKTAAAVELFGYAAVYCDPLTARVMAAIRAAA
jgi:RNA polymerase sigma-70 factor (ECF subfamily)